jgi:hypothetical protein
MKSEIVTAAGLNLIFQRGNVFIWQLQINVSLVSKKNMKVTQMVLGVLLLLAGIGTLETERGEGMEFKYDVDDSSDDGPDDSQFETKAPGQKFKNGNFSMPSAKEALKINEGEFHPFFTREELGRMGWSMLHLISAYFPEHPTDIDKQDIKDFLR